MLLFFAREFVPWLQLVPFKCGNSGQANVIAAPRQVIGDRTLGEGMRWNNKVVAHLKDNNRVMQLKVKYVPGS